MEIFCRRAALITSRRRSSLSSLQIPYNHQVANLDPEHDIHSIPYSLSSLLVKVLYVLISWSFSYYLVRTTLACWEIVLSFGTNFKGFISTKVFEQKFKICMYVAEFIRMFFIKILWIDQVQGIVSCPHELKYSCIPNRRIGLNKRIGLTIVLKK